MNAIDTNVLIYAADSDERVKGPVAIALIERLSQAPLGTIILWQVLCEFTAFLAKYRRRSNTGPEVFEFGRAVRNRFPLAIPSARALDLAVEIHLAEQVSIWDAMLIAACSEAGVTTLYSEDLQSREVIRGVRIVNPFA